MAEITDTGERIKLKAKDLFMQFGLRSVSMDDIANSLGISKKTIYQFYEDKDALVEGVIEALIEHNQMCCDKDTMESDNAIHEIFLAMDFMMDIFRSMNPSLVFDMQKYYPAAYSKFAKHKNEYIFGTIKQNVIRGIKEELYRADLNVDVIARFRVESVMLPFDPSFHTKVKLGLAAIEEELMLYFLYGMVSPKGYKLAQKYQQERIQKLKKEEEK
jgi:AcrR family transcriptional regulator